MLRYRALLIDTELSYERPIQQFFNDIDKATDWAVKALRVASEKATVVIYRIEEVEMHSLSREDFDDKIPVQSVGKVTQKAS